MLNTHNNGLVMHMGLELEYVRVSAHRRREFVSYEV